MAAETPLFSRDLGDTIAISRGNLVSCRDFLGQVLRVADSLPDRPIAINVCEDRYTFMLGFCAAIVRGQSNLLLPSHQPGAVHEASMAPDNRYVLHDGKFSSFVGAAFDISPALIEQVSATQIPAIADDQLAAIVHTSGSTGESTQILKYWRTLHRSAAINLPYLLGDSAGDRVSVLATVPPGHMWGMETSILLPLFSDALVYSGNTLFPGDILAGLEQMPGKRILVSTPVHLRAIVNSGLEFPAVDRVLSATAPLARDAARTVARIFSAEVVDMYGCSETGLLAYRPIVRETRWRFFDAFRVEHDGHRTIVDADHLPESVELADALEFQDDGRFTIQGRDTDLVKIGGKRGSLANLTDRLLAIDGVEDAIIFQLSRPDEDAEVRLSALVVAPDRTPIEIRTGLAEVVDPVFLPRPIRCVDSLPRSSTGKLRKAELEKLVGELHIMA